MTGRLRHPDDPQPGTGALLDADGRRLREAEHIRPIGMARVMRLDADGRPAGAPVRVPVDRVTVVRAFVPQCRWCGMQGGHAPGCPMAEG